MFLPWAKMLSTVFGTLGNGVCGAIQGTYFDALSQF